MAVIFHIEGDKIPFVPVSLSKHQVQRSEAHKMHGGGLRIFLYDISSAAVEQKNLT